MYLQELDLVINFVTNMFNQPGNIPDNNMEGLLTVVADGKNFKEKVKTKTDFYLNDFDNYKLDLQLIYSNLQR